MTVAVHAATDVGLRRQQNEDSHGIWMADDPEDRRRRGVLLVVADGMGGSLAGEVASRIAVQTVLRVYQEAHGDPFDDLVEAVSEANSAVHAESTSHPDLSGMGTTCTALVVREHDLLIAHVGDSRAYLTRNGRIRQITHDHSLVAQMVREGQLTPDQAKVDPRRNVVTRSVGVGPQVEIDADRLESALEPGDTLLMCSDGLHGLVTDPELAEISSLDDLGEACREAIDLANRRGGHDNITIVLARVDDGVDVAHSRDVEITAEFPPHEDPSEWESGTVLDDEEPGARPGRNGGAGAIAASGRPSSGKLMMWLIVALTVLLLAVVAMALVWKRLDHDRRALDAESGESARGTSATTSR